MDVTFGIVLSCISCCGSKRQDEEVLLKSSIQEEIRLDFLREKRKNKSQRIIASDTDTYRYTASQLLIRQRISRKTQSMYSMSPKQICSKSQNNASVYRLKQPKQTKINSEIAFYSKG